MPCYDYNPAPPRPTQQDLDASLTSAVLCAFTRAIERKLNIKQFHTYVDWEEAGVTEEQYLDWWNRHKLIDEDRIMRMRDTIRLEKKKKAALEKLTGEERLLLGLG